MFIKFKSLLRVGTLSQFLTKKMNKLLDLILVKAVRPTMSVSKKGSCVTVDQVGIMTK